MSSHILNPFKRVYHWYLYKASLRQKIILPSFLIFGLFTLSLLIYSFYLLSTSVETFYALIQSVLADNVPTQQFIKEANIDLIAKRHVYMIKRDLFIGILSTFFVVCTTLWVLYVFLIRRMTSAIEALIQLSHDVAYGDLSQEITSSHQDEFGELSHAFNKMVSNLRDAASIVLKERKYTGAIVTSLPLAIILTDLDNTLILANSKAEEMFDFSQEKIKGKKLLAYITNEDLISVLQEKLDVSNDHISREITIADAQGKQNEYLLMSSIAKSKSGRPLGTVTVLQDVTHENEISDLKEGFLRTVSHELRTPLTTIIGFIDIIHKGEQNLTEDQRKCINIVQKESASLKTLIENLLDLSRLSAGQLIPHYSSLYAYETVSHICDTFKQLAKRKSLTLILKDIPTTLCFDADNSMFRRIMMNLISNAIKFTNQGEVVVSCESTETTITFHIKDTGIGLMEKEKTIIFEQFRQIDFSSTRQYEGIGLGLSIVKNLVELHNGIIEVTSEYGKGSTFSVIFPRHVATNNTKKKAPKS